MVDALARLTVGRGMGSTGDKPSEAIGHRDHGRTFVVVTPLRGPTETLVVVNWADEARQRWRGGGAK